jgi:hypothetical protein
MFSFKKFLMAMLLIFSVSIVGIAEAGIVTDKMPLQCYVDHKVTSYDTGTGRAVGWIDADVDLVQITGINGGNGVAIGTHPSGNRRVERLFWARDVFADTNYANRDVHVNGSHQVYRTKNSGATIGSISNENVTVVADNGNRAQIIYRLNNGTGYKMGWVPSSVVNGGGNTTNIKGDANNDGKVTEDDAQLIRNYIVGNVSDSDINKNNADVNGDGQINIFDAVAVLNTIKNNPAPTPDTNNKLQDLINRLNGSRWVDHSYSSTSSQCKEFAQYIFNELYGVRGVGSGSTSKNPTNWRLNNIPSSIYQVAEVPENRNAAQAKEQFRNLFAQAQSGDFIQIKRGSGGAHSAIFVARTSNGIQWFDANADGNNGIKLQTYSYDDLVKTTRKGYQWNVAMSLYRARNR